MLPKEGVPGVEPLPGDTTLGRLFFFSVAKQKLAHVDSVS